MRNLEFTAHNCPPAPSASARPLECGSCLLSAMTEMIHRMASRTVDSRRTGDRNSPARHLRCHLEPPVKFASLFAGEFSSPAGQCAPLLEKMSTCKSLLAHSIENPPPNCCPRATGACQTDTRGAFYIGVPIIKSFSQVTLLGIGRIWPARCVIRLP
jgi:hypothetical protein